MVTLPRRIQLYILAAYCLICVVAIVVAIVEMAEHSAGPHVVAWATAGIFTLATLPLMLWLIFGHLVYYTNPPEQRYLVRIIWMVPIYSIDANIFWGNCMDGLANTTGVWYVTACCFWTAIMGAQLLAIRFPPAAIYLDTVRECYEAYVIYNFMAFLLTFLDSAYPHFDLHLQLKPPTHHIVPFCCLPTWRMGSQIINRCKHGVLQYTVLRPIATVLALIFQAVGCYGEGDFSFTNGWTYVVMLNNISQIWALYCLVLFYKATKEELSPVKPLWKFMAVKLVVFLSFWQGVLIAIFVKVGIISDQVGSFGYVNAEEVATGLQDWLISIEMFLISLLFLKAFAYTPYIPMSASENTWTGNGRRLFHAVPSLWDVSDVTRDVIGHLRAVETKIKDVRHLGSGSWKRPAPGADKTAERCPLLYSNDDRSVPSAYVQLHDMPSSAATTPSDASHSAHFGFDGPTRARASTRDSVVESSADAFVTPVASAPTLPLHSSQPSNLSEPSLAATAAADALSEAVMTVIARSPPSSRLSSYGAAGPSTQLAKPAALASPPPIAASSSSQSGVYWTLGQQAPSAASGQSLAAPPSSGLLQSLPPPISRNPLV